MTAIVCGISFIVSVICFSFEEAIADYIKAKAAYWYAKAESIRTNCKKLSNDVQNEGE